MKKFYAKGCHEFFFQESEHVQVDSTMNIQVIDLR